jgi:transketolase
MSKLENLKELSMLLSVKECDLRSDTIEQCKYSIDKGIHIGGAFSAITPLTALYYGGFMNYNVENPTSLDQDIFILSKGHAVAALASVYADVGYFDKKHLKNSRSYGSLIKGHPGPIIPGVPVATGPLGHGISIACGYALKGREDKNSSVFCLVGDGELQEGSCWEGIMFAGDRQLQNLCILVDKNGGQSDNTQQLFLKLDTLQSKFESFGFNVIETNGYEIGSLLLALEQFKSFAHTAKPTAIICNSIKGLGGYSGATEKHKASFSDEEIDVELTFMKQTRSQRVHNLSVMNASIVDQLADKIGYVCERDASNNITSLKRLDIAVKTKRAPIRDKSIRYDQSKLPVLDKSKEYGASDMAINIMKVLAEDSRIYSIDADLSNVSGLYDGVKMTNRFHAINAGIAECNMMCMAEGLAACGSNVWVSTFGPFFDWQAFRRIAVSYQERMESMEAAEGWLSEGHNLDITFLSTASNLDTATNGATHMSNDDICVFNQMAHLKVIDTCCPQQLLSIAEWIAQGNKGLVYLRVMRNKSKVLYSSDFKFEYGKGYYLRQGPSSCPVIISSGHGVLEALSAADLLEKDGIFVSVLDMPSCDLELFRELASSSRLVLFAEQNNGSLFNCFSQYVLQNHISFDINQIRQISTLTTGNQPQFIQSGTYSQLIQALELSPDAIAQKLKTYLKEVTK